MAAAIASTTVGASGAIYGILVAFAMFFPDAKLMLFFVPYPIAARYFIPIIVALDLFSGFTGFSLLVVISLTLPTWEALSSASLLCCIGKNTALIRIGGTDSGNK